MPHQQRRLRGGRDGGVVPVTGTDALAALDAQAPSIVAAIVPVMLDGALPAAAAQRAEAIREFFKTVNA